ncbi:MAG: lamin tail domain-containing protein, partial [Bacteroidales bacterium]|nr:lamin tail domain-containing protein [Bacteroidales bacterium]
DGAFDDAFVADPSFMYNTPGTYDVALRVTDDDTNTDTETKTGYITVVTPIEVANLAALRAGIVGEIYKVTGEVVLTYQMDFRNQKYIQDATAGVLIDDDAGIITTTYNLYEGITGLVGTLGEYNNMTQFVPFTDPGLPTPGYVPTPEVVTIDDLLDSFDDYEAELVKLLDVSFADANGDTTFLDGKVYPISDLSKAFGHFRTTFYFEDYIGTIIPATADITVLPNARDTINIVTCRNLADFEVESNDPTQLAVVSVNGGFDPYVSTDFSVVVQAQDAGDVPAIVTGDVIFTFSTNDPGSVDFTPSSTLGGTIISGTSQVTVTGVQMAPAGTNVTITAVDDNIFGLANGVSDPFNVVEIVIPDLIICEIMCDPVAVGDTDGEWFEVYNNGATDVDLFGFVIKDNDYDSTTIDLSVIVPAGGFAVLGRNDDPLFNGDYTCDYMYSGISLGNSADEVVLTLPDGLTEIDRVEYDGGPVWPDPAGTSMTFHGFVSDDNNDGTNWTYSTFREASYVGTVGDRGTPGSEGYDQIMTGGFKLDLKVLLEGPYNAVNDSMTNDLRAQGFIPADQPFNPATPYYGNNNPVWQYGGTETTSYFPFYGTDWLLIELRDAASAGVAGSGSMVAQYPAYLMVDGTVVSLNGATPLNIKDSYSNSLFFVIWHRNHLGIMTASGLNPVDGTIETYDFSTSNSQAYGVDAQKFLGSGIYGMIAGDVDADGSVDGSDNADGWGTDAGKAGYNGGDLDLNGQSNNQDKNDVWLPNDGISSQVPN